MSITTTNHAPRTVDDIRDDYLTARAMAAYFQAAYEAEEIVDRPDGLDGYSRVHVTKDGKEYVVLEASGDRILAVYRVRNDGKLKRLRRWPAEFGGAGATEL